MESEVLAALISGLVAVVIAVLGLWYQRMEFLRKEEAEERRHREMLRVEEERYEEKLSVLADRIDALQPAAPVAAPVDQGDPDDDTEQIIAVVQDMFKGGRKARSYGRIKAKLPWVTDERLREIMGSKMSMEPYKGRDTGKEFWRFR